MKIIFSEYEIKEMIKDYIENKYKSKVVPMPKDIDFKFRNMLGNWKSFNNFKAEVLIEPVKRK